MATKYLHREHVEAAEAEAFEALKAELYDLPALIAAKCEGKAGGDIERIVRMHLHDIITRFDADLLGRLDRLPRIDATA